LPPDEKISPRQEMPIARLEFWRCPTVNDATFFVEKIGMVAAYRAY
jgi:hypothetical protein